MVNLFNYGAIILSAMNQELQRSIVKLSLQSVSQSVSEWVARSCIYFMEQFIAEHEHNTETALDHLNRGVCLSLGLSVESPAR